MFARDHSRRRSGRPAAAQIDTIAGDPCRHRPLKANELGISIRSIGDTLALLVGERYVNRFNRVARSYEVIQQVPLTPETLTRYYVNSAAGQHPEGSYRWRGKAVIGCNVKLAAAGALLDVPLGHKANHGRLRISTRSRSQ